MWPSRKGATPKRSVLERPDYEPADVHALRALQGGTATPEQQQRALRYIIEIVCGTYDFPFRPGADDRETNIALGRMKAGQDIVFMLNTARIRRAGEPPDEHGRQ